MPDPRLCGDALPAVGLDGAFVVLLPRGLNAVPGSRLRVLGAANCQQCSGACRDTQASWFCDSWGCPDLVGGLSRLVTSSVAAALWWQVAICASHSGWCRTLRNAYVYLVRFRSGYDRKKLYFALLY